MEFGSSSGRNARKEVTVSLFAALLAAPGWKFVWNRDGERLSHWTQDLVNIRIVRKSCVDPGFEDEDGTIG